MEATDTIQLNVNTQSSPSVCPGCGRCNHCGHTPARTWPYPFQQPSTPYPYPVTYGDGAITVTNEHTHGGV